MILLHKFIFSENGMYNAGCYLGIEKYYHYSITVTRGNFMYFMDSVRHEAFIINRSSDIRVEINPTNCMHNIWFYNKNFGMDLIFETSGGYESHTHFHIGHSYDIKFLIPEKVETRVAIYKIYYNAGKNTMKRYCNARGNYEV